MSGHYVLPVEQGVTLRFTVALSQTTEDPDVTEPYDLTGCTAELRIDSTPATGYPLVVSTEDTDGLTIELPNVVNVHLTARQTALIGRRSRYVLDVTFPSGDTKRVLEGGVQLDLNVPEGEG